MINNSLVFAKKQHFTSFYSNTRRPYGVRLPVHK